jgi:hypothetical protein
MYLTLKNKLAYSSCVTRRHHHGDVGGNLIMVFVFLAALYAAWTVFKEFTRK